MTPRRNGRLHHISIGRSHARARAILLIQDLEIRITNAATGELLRELTRNLDRGYQPIGASPQKHATR